MSQQQSALNNRIIGESPIIRWTLFVLFIATAAILRIYHLSWQSLWNDEMFSIQISSLPLARIQSELLAQAHHPPLFFYLLHIANDLFGTNEWSLRIISAVAGALTVGGVFLIGDESFGMAPASFAAAVCCIAPFHLAYSQEGRPYALAALFCLLSLYCFWKAIRSGALFWMLWYAITALALLYTHHWGLFFVAIQAVYGLLSYKKNAIALKQLILLYLAIFIFYLPGLFGLLHQVPPPNLPAWFWAERPSPREVLDIAGAFSGTYFKMASSVFALHPPIRIAGALIVLVVCIASFWIILEKHLSEFSGYALVCFFGTLLIPFLISFKRPEIFLWYRYTVIVFPIFCLMGAGMAYHMEKRWYGIGLLLLLICTSMAGMMRYYSWEKSNVKSVVSYVERLTRSDFKLVVRPKLFSPLFNYYYRGDARQADETYLDGSLGPIIDTSSAFVLISLDVPDEIREYIDRHFLKIDERIFPGEAHMGIVVGAYRRSDKLTEPTDDLMALGTKEENSKVFQFRGEGERRLTSSAASSRRR